MILDDWIRAIYEDVPEVLVGLPVKVSSLDSIVASCNSDSTSTLHLDRFVDHVDPCPFATAAQVGTGFAVLIAGNVSSDVWLEGCPHNPRWLTDLANFLVHAAEEDLKRRTSHRRSPHLLFLSHRSTDKATVSTVAAAIKRGGLGIWFDEERLIPSQSLTRELSRALGKMTHFVLFWSEQCVGAPWVERELNSAVSLLLDKQIPLLIVRLDRTPVPAVVADIFRIEATGESGEAVAGQIIEAVEQLSRTGAHDDGT